MMLESISSPNELKKLNIDELALLSRDIREKILQTVSKNGGHLASNLGIVELTVALHYAFDCPHDKLIFDVGHQCYAHKLLTGRSNKFTSLRQYGGISGFTNRDECDYDTLTAGHSGSSLSSALGFAEAARISGEDNFTVVVVGDGSFTNGMIYEALNNCTSRPLRLIIILNDNGMSISPNVGGLSEYLSRIRTSEGYFAFKCFMKKRFVKLPFIGKYIVSAAKHIKNTLKRVLLNTNMFESLGIEYLGPVDGNDINKVISVLEEAKGRNECTIVHVRTKKGLGYFPSENSPERYHSTPPFDIETGIAMESSISFTNTVSETLCNAAQSDKRLCAVCAAMPEGTGLDGFADLYPDRFFDVGIAEEHAIAFSGGLSLSGYRPACVIYSTFAERVYDQVMHDIALQNTPLMLLLSHAGLVPGDGCTHQGIFDVSLFSSVPGINIYSPDSYDELKLYIESCIPSRRFNIIRYPKGTEPFYDRSVFIRENQIFSYNTEYADTVIVTYGRITEVAVAAASLTKCKTGVIRAAQVCPIDCDTILRMSESAEIIYILEEGIKQGGFAERLASLIAEKNIGKNIIIHAIDNDFSVHGKLSELFLKYSFTPEKISERIDYEFDRLPHQNNMQAEKV